MSRDIAKATTSATCSSSAANRWRGHKELRPMVRYAVQSRASIRMICSTNGGLWTDENMRPVDDGLDQRQCPSTRTISRRMSRTAARPDVCRKDQTRERIFHGVGIQTTASITASRLIEDYLMLPAFFGVAGFRSCTFSYPPVAVAREQPSQLQRQRAGEFPTRPNSSRCSRRSSR